MKAGEGKGVETVEAPNMNGGRVRQEEGEGEGEGEGTQKTIWKARPLTLEWWWRGRSIRKKKRWTKERMTQT